MADHPGPGSGLGEFAHRVLDRLTAMKLHVGSLRHRLRQGTVAAEEIETHLDRLDQEIDATAALAQDVRAAEGSSSA